MYYTVYKITNVLNGKFYIGKHKTKDLDDGYMGSGKLIKRAIEKHGVENFKKDILHVFETESEMNKAEARLVVLNEDSYNLCPGGEGGFGYINEKKLNIYENHTAIAKRNLSIAAETRVKNDAYFKLMKANSELGIQKLKALFPQGTWKGRKHSDETKAKIKASKKDKQLASKNSQYGTAWITNGVINKKIKKIDIVPEGWYKGRVSSNQGTTSFLLP